MIASIFNKSNPIIFALTILSIGISLFLGFYYWEETPINAVISTKYAITFLVLVLCVFTLKYTTKLYFPFINSDFVCITFSFFLLIFPIVIIHLNLVIANFLILIALYKLLSIEKEKRIRLNLLDTSLCIVIATAFYFWASLFFTAIFIVLILNQDFKIKHWLIPFVGLSIVVILYVGFTLLMQDLFFLEITTKIPTINLNIANYKKNILFIPALFFIAITAWIFLLFIKNKSLYKRSEHTAIKTTYLFIIIAIIIIVIAPNKTGSSFIFMLGPLAIATTTYFSKLNAKRN